MGSSGLVLGGFTFSPEAWIRRADVFLVPHSRHFLCTKLYFRRGTESDVPASLLRGIGDSVTVSQSHFHARQAAAALLKMAMTTSDQKIVAGLVAAAAALKDQAGELAPPISTKAPDVMTEE